MKSRKTAFLDPCRPVAMQKVVSSFDNQTHFGAVTKPQSTFLGLMHAVNSLPHCQRMSDLGKQHCIWLSDSSTLPCMQPIQSTHISSRGSKEAVASIVNNCDNFGHHGTLNLSLSLRSLSSPCWAVMTALHLGREVGQKQHER